MMKTIAFIFAASLSSPALAVESATPYPGPTFCMFATQDDDIYIGIAAATADAAKTKCAAHFKDEKCEQMMCARDQGDSEK